jgi:hypothetical protein
MGMVPSFRYAFANKKGEPRFAHSRMSELFNWPRITRHGGWVIGAIKRAVYRRIYGVAPNRRSWTNAVVIGGRVGAVKKKTILFLAKQGVMVTVARRLFTILFYVSL